MKVLDDYEAAKRAVFEHVGYVEVWTDYPLDDLTDKFWTVDPREDSVHFADTIAELERQDDQYFKEEIIQHPHAPQRVYVGAEYSMIAIDTHCDGNKFLAVFDNAKRQDWREEWDT